jgi:hypothetical protein
MTVRDLERLLKTSQRKDLLRSDGTHFSDGFFEHGFKPFKKYVDNLANESEHEDVTYDDVAVRDALLDFDGMERMLRKFRPTTLSNYVGHIRACADMDRIAKEFADAAQLKRAAEHWAKYYSGANAARYQAQKKETPRAAIDKTVRSTDAQTDALLRDKDAIIASLREELAAAKAREQMLERERQQLWTALLARDQQPSTTDTKKKTKKKSEETPSRE